MALSGIEPAAVARCLGQLATGAADHAEAYFERVEEVELPSDEESPGVRARHEEGLAIRLLRGSEAWMASVDGLSREGFAEALRRVARVQPRAGYPAPELTPSSAEASEPAPEILHFPAAVRRVIREHHVAFRLRLTVRRHRRWRQVVGSRLAGGAELEVYYSFAARTAWGSFGGLLAALDAAAAAAVGRQLVAHFRSRDAVGVGRHAGVTVLGPAAAAVLVHEAVAHALETDTLARTGRPESAVGVRLAASLDVLDDPTTAPETVRRLTDDEGVPVVRRWLLREGVVEQPLADLRSARESGILAPGAGRRAGRHHGPVPRSTHLEILPSPEPVDLLADVEGGLLIPEATRGRLDPWTGRFLLEAPYARRIVGGLPADRVGPCRLAGRVSDLLGAIVGVGSEVEVAGAGWCAKGGQLLPVWARVPALRLEGVEVES